DRATFRNCRFLGWQDTIFANRGRQYFEGCYIAGHVDFIFGAATMFFERCHIHCLKDGYITAASTPASQPFGFVFANCKITGETPEVKTFLGRPWRGYGSTIFLNTEMSAVVRPEGWNNWYADREKTARYYEHHSTGSGASPQTRVKWARQLSEAELHTLTPEIVLAGTDGWNPNPKAAQAATPATPPAAAPQAAKVSPYEDPALKGRVKTEIEYRNVAGESLRLDVALPEGAGPFPAAILVHGGGWMAGDKTGGVNPLFVPLLRSGIAWFTINYRLAPKHRYPASVEDVEAAVRWVKEHAAEYKIDPNRLALVGESAGGHLVAMAAVRAQDQTRAANRVAAVVPFYAPFDMLADMERRGGLSTSMRALFGRDRAEPDDAIRQILREASPINDVRPGLPPFLLVHGTADASVLYLWSTQMQAKLKAAGVSCDLITITDGVHGMARWENTHPGYKDQVAAWLADKLGSKQNTRR
ncbi:MAG TPA: pectinesterase family protein, partial [Blastocatellia bacterium]|nr:pectinesterase family protein [Blastocatellia bacterium]